MHEEDIVSFAVHPKGNIIATGQINIFNLLFYSIKKFKLGQMAQKSKSKAIDIFVWDSETK